MVGAARSSSECLVMPTASVSLHSAALAFARRVSEIYETRINQAALDPDEEPAGHSFDALVHDLNERIHLSRLARAVCDELRSSPWPELARNFGAFAKRADPDTCLSTNLDFDLSLLMTDLEPILGCAVTSMKTLRLLEEREPVVTEFGAVEVVLGGSETTTKYDRPSDQRQSDIIATILSAGTPLQGDEIVSKLRRKTPGRIKNDLSWMVKTGVLVNIRGEGYWPSAIPYPN